MGKGRNGEDALSILRGRVIGCAVRVHKALGPGFLESIYHRALEIELAENGIPFESEKEIKVTYRGRFVGDHHLDLFVDDCLVVELKTIEKVRREHYAQARSYLKAVGQEVGLLFNFGVIPLDVRRVASENALPPFSSSPFLPPYTGAHS